MALINFFKMHGLGNDFVVIEDYAGTLVLNPDQIRHLADRRRGIGFDQLIILRPSVAYPCYMEIFNADGSSSGVCINASRCVAGMLMERFGLLYLELDSPNGIIKAFKLSDKTVSLIIAKASFTPENIPFIGGGDNLSIDFGIKNLPRGAALSVGNPHVVFFVDDIDKFNLAEIGPKIENHPFFPERANVTIARIIDSDKVMLKTWERGAGETLACGSAASATAAVIVRLELSKSHIFNMFMPGGELSVEVLLDYYLKVTGSYEVAFVGAVELN